MSALGTERRSAIVFGGFNRRIELALLRRRPKTFPPTRAFAQFVMSEARDCLPLVAMGFVGDLERTTLRLRGPDCFVLGFVFSLFLPATPQKLSFLGAALRELHFWLFRSDCPRLALLEQLCLAISAYKIWREVVIRLVSVPVLRFETAMITNVG